MPACFRSRCFAPRVPTAIFWYELTREIYKIGARSLPIIAVGGAFVGLSVTLLGYRALLTYGAGNQISCRWSVWACIANSRRC